MKCRIKNIEINDKAVATFVKAQKRALELTVEAIRSDIISRGAVPFDTGTLEQGGELKGVNYDSGYVEKIDDCIFYIIYNTPYARRWYFNLEGANFKRETSQDHWMDYYLEGEGLQWVESTLIKNLKKVSEGVVT